MTPAATEANTIGSTIPPELLSSPAPHTVTDPRIDLDWLNRRIEYQRFVECIHCGMCTSSCPTFVETGNENDSPRGRIYLMRSVTDGRVAMSDEIRHHLDLCLDCRACETACPSGVKYSHMIEPYKIALVQSPEGRGRMGWLLRMILHHLFPYPRRVKLALLPAYLAQKTGLLGLLRRTGFMKLLPATLDHMQEMLPDLQIGERLPEVLPPIGPKRARVALFLGCVADAMYPATNAATARVLQHNGCEVVIPRGQECCGAIHYHSGAEAPAFDMARANLKAFDPPSVDAILINAAGCGAMFKDYAHILPADLHDRATRFVAKTMDVSEFLYQLGLVLPKHKLPARVTYHDACHLAHAQKIRSQPRVLLQMIPGLDLVPLDESELCCGAAGTYNLVQPEMSDRLGERKAENVEKTDAAFVAAGNVGCIIQIAKKLRERGSKTRAVHTMDLLDMAYSGDPTPANPDHRTSG